MYPQLRMAQGRGSALVFTLAVLALLNVVSAKDYTVGDATGWSYAEGNFYDSWAAKQTFVPGDNLVFKYGVNEHDVQIVTAAEYEGCTSGNGKKYTSGSDSIPLPKAGDYYFLCTYPLHCSMGMKMKVTVKAGAATPPATPPASPPPKATPPPASPPVESPPPKASPPPPASPPVVSPPPKVSPPPATPPPTASPPVVLPTPAKAPTPPPVGAPAPVEAPGPAPVPEVAPTPGGVVAPTPSVVPTGPAQGPTPPSSSGQSLRVCFSFVGAAVVAALLV